MPDAIFEVRTHTRCVHLVRPSSQSAPTESARLAAQAAQAEWCALPIARRLRVLQSARHWMAEHAGLFTAAISVELSRTPADTLAAELLPLLEACRFLERNAPRILAPRRLGRRGLPFWLSGVRAEVHRVALGTVLIVGPSNYPLFLPGVQTFQALAAGNAVVWKPGRGGRAVAALVAEALHAAGLPPHLLRVTGESIEAAQSEVQAVPDKVFFTGSAYSGSALSRQLAETSTPSIMELSGCDAVIALPSADWLRLVKALVFGMRLNGSATCMAPRRLILVGLSPELRDSIAARLLAEFDRIPGTPLPESTRQQLTELLHEASASGATVFGELCPQQQPILVTNVIPAMSLACSDLFAPVLMVLAAADEAEGLRAVADCPYALTAAVFGSPREACALAKKITAGTVLVNDLIVPTADPRVPFGGRRRSGFGVTRGAEGLLEMTAVKVVSVRRGKDTKHFEPTTTAHHSLFTGVILAWHAGAWRERWRGVKQLFTAARDLRGKG